MRSPAPAAMLVACLSLAIAVFAVPRPTYAENPALTVVVAHDAARGEAEYGSSVGFSYTVTNSGDETITALAVDDDWAGHLGDSAVLEPGAAVTFERTIVIEGSIGGRGVCRATGTSAGGEVSRRLTTTSSMCSSPMTSRTSHSRSGSFPATASQVGGSYIG